MVLVFVSEVSENDKLHNDKLEEGISEHHRRAAKRRHCRRDPPETSRIVRVLHVT